MNMTPTKVQQKMKPQPMQPAAIYVLGAICALLAGMEIVAILMEVNGHYFAWIVGAIVVIAGFIVGRNVKFPWTKTTIVAAILASALVAPGCKNVRIDTPCLTLQALRCAQMLTSCLQPTDDKDAAELAKYDPVTSCGLDKGDKE